MGRGGGGWRGREGGGRERKSDEQHKKVQKRRKEESSVFSFSFSPLCPIYHIGFSGRKRQGFAGN